MKDRTTSTVFRDFTMLMVLGFVAMVVWLLPHVNPPADNASDPPPGNLIVAITWPEGDTDVDLWLSGPGELNPVGYSNKGGVLFNLLRDDLGNSPDATPLNYENAYTRGIVPGEYIVNVHCYRCPVLPQKITVETSINTGEDGKGSKPIATTTTILTANGQEKTAMRFKIDSTGSLIDGTLSQMHTPLREAK